MGSHLILFSGWCIPAILSLSLSPWLDLCLGLAVSLYLTYIHQPQFLSEILFLRSVQVMGHHFQHLNDHLECCIRHRNLYSADVSRRNSSCNRTNSSNNNRMNKGSCCVGRCASLLRLFTNIEETFQGQLLIQFTIILGTLIFGNDYPWNRFYIP